MSINLNVIKRILFFVVSLFLCQVSFAQTLSQLTKQERLKVLLSENDTSKIRALTKLAKAHNYLFIQYKHPEHSDSTFLAYNMAMKIANAYKTADKNYWQMTVLSGIGEAECYAGDTVNGRKKIFKALGFFASNHFIDDELNCWGILNKTAEYHGNAKDQLSYLNVLQIRALRYKKINMLIKTKEWLIDLIANSGNLDTMPKLYLSLIKEYKNTSAAELDYAYVQLARYYRYKGNLSNALYYALAARDWMIKTSDTTNRKKSFIYGELAEIYQFLGNSAKSIFWYKKTIEVRRKEKLSQVSIYRTTGFLVQEHIKLKQATEALAYITNLAREFPPIGGDNEANLFQMKAYCYEALGKVKLAEDAYLNMIKRYKAFPTHPVVLQIANYDIGKFFVNQKQFQKASLYISEKNFVSGGAAEMKDYHYLQYKIDSANKNYPSALHHLNTFKNISDSIFNVTKSKQIAELEIKYATEQKENDIRILKKDQLIQNENIKRANLTRNWILSGVFLLFLVIGLLYNSFSINQKKSKEIDLKNASLSLLIAEKDDLLQDKEWLLKEIHHRVKNNLQIITSLLHSQSIYINNDEALVAIQNSENRVHAIALIHQKLYQSESLELISIPAYVEELIGYLKGSYSLDNRITFEKHLEAINLHVAQAVTLGLILNEAITNAIKYAYGPDEAGVIYIKMGTGSDNRYNLTISDDGPGFSRDFDFDKVDSLGLNLIRGLCKQLGGTLEYSSDQGCRINITFNRNF